MGFWSLFLPLFVLVVRDVDVESNLLLKNNVISYRNNEYITHKF